MELERKKLRCQYIDYGRNGAYFLTICTFERQRLFGLKPFQVKNWHRETGLYQYGDPAVDGETLPSSVRATLCGSPRVLQMIEKWIHELPRKFKNVKVDYYVIMPDHVHLILFIVNGEDLGLPHRVAPTDQNKGRTQNTKGISEIIDWFKTMTTNDYIRGVRHNLLPPFNYHLWQRGFFDHVIRNSDDLLECRRYIKNNPRANPTTTH